MFAFSLFQLWEGNAARHVSMATQLSEVTAIIVRWRKLELRFVEYFYLFLCLSVSRMGQVESGLAVDCFSYSAIFCSWADSLHTCHMWFWMNDCSFFFLTIFWISTEVVYLQHCLVITWLVLCELLLSWHILCTPYKDTRMFISQWHLNVHRNSSWIQTCNL